MISLRVNSRAVWARASCSSVRLRSMARAIYHPGERARPPPEPEPEPEPEPDSASTLMNPLSTSRRSGSGSGSGSGSADKRLAQLSIFRSWSCAGFTLGSYAVADRFGSWEVEALLAVGGLGEVWRARRADEPAEIAAVKRLHTHLARNAEACAMFAAEQRLATTLPRHANVIHGLEAADVAGRPYVALE